MPADTVQTQPVTVIDRVGRSVTFERVPQRIISLLPSTTELLFAIGAGPSIVGATKHCNYPAEALEIPRVGSGTLEGISRETILALKPDLVLCKWDTHEPLLELFDRVGIQAINLGPETLEELFDEAKLLGRATGHEQEAEALIKQMTERRDRLVERVASLEPSQKRTVFYEVWDDPLMTAGPKSFIGELLKLGQMKNIFDDTDVRYPRISSEVVVDRNPDVMLAPTNHMKQIDVERLASRAGWANINAITKKQVFIINGDEVSRCGPRLLNALEQMIDAVYPETKLKETQQP
jgi:iron complex transport system substrate-binding protein